VIPGSQTCGVLTDKQVFEMAREYQGVDCLVGQGAVLVMTPLLIHASSKADLPVPRRVLHFEYAASRELAAGIRLALT